MLRLNLEYEVLEPRILFAADQTSQTGQTSDSTSATVEPVAVPPSPGDTHDLAPADVSAPAVAPKDIVFISDAVEGYETLVAAYSAEHEVVLLDHTGDNLAQMASVLSGRSDLAAIHILSHGSSGDIALGTVDLNSQNISQYAEAISKIGRALSADGDILFYGCNIAESADGKMLVEKIASLSAADVAALDATQVYSLFVWDELPSFGNLKEAAGAASQAIENFFVSKESAAFLPSIFGNIGDLSAADHRDNIRVELRSDHELAGALGAFVADAGDAAPKIFVNRDYLATASKLDVKRVLIEEYGHYLDHKINGMQDTPGDEGEVFATTVIFGIPPDQDRLALADNDHRTLMIDGHYLDVETAIAREVSLVFTSGYFGTQASSTNKTNSIKTFATVGVARIAFVQTDANGDGLFGDGGTQGNDLAGKIRIYKTDGTTVELTGALNWRETTGSRLDVFGIIFDASNSNTALTGFTIKGGTTSGTSTNLGLKAASSPVTFTDGENRSGNAANTMLDELNSYLTSQPKVNTVTASTNNVVEGNNLVYTVSLSIAPTATTYFTFTKGGTATSGSDYNSIFIFSNGVTLNADGTLSVPSGVSSFTITVVTIDDALSENTETLDIAVGGVSTTGSILDNDDTRNLTVTGLSDVSEGSQAIFKVTLDATVSRATNISLAWANGQGANSSTSSSDYVVTYGSSLTDTSNAIVYYYANGVQTALTVTNGVVSLPSDIATFYVRVPTVQDLAFEGKEDFQLTAQIVGGNSASGTSTIVDDGTGKVYSNIDSSGTALYSGTSDDDRTLSITASGPVNEASQYAMFTVTAEKGIPVNLSISQSGSAPATITNFSFQYSTDGTNWTTYTWDNSTSLGNRPTLPSGSGTGKIYVRVDISTEQDNLYEGQETFTLTAAYGSGGQKSANAVSTIRDDGNGSIYTGAISGGSPVLDTVTAIDNDAGLKVSFVTVNEGSDWAVFQVDANKDDVLTLSFSDGTTSGFSNPSLTFDVFVNGAWSAYNPANKPVVAEGVSGSGKGSVFVRVRLTPEQDNVYEGSETFTLTATKAGPISTSGTGTIVDDGTGTKYTGEIVAGQPATDGAGSKDDDRPTLTVSGVDDVSEGSYAVFTIDLSKATKNDVVIELSLPGTSPDTATKGTDYSSSYTAFYFVGNIKYDLSIVANQITLPAGVTKFFVAVSTNTDSGFEGSENFTLQAGFNSATFKYVDGVSDTERAGASNSDMSIILDNGSGRNYDGTVTGGIPNSNTTGVDDDRTLAISAYGPVNEASPYAMFTVTANSGQQLSLTLGNTASNADRDATITNFALKYYDSNSNSWQPYDPNNPPTVDNSRKIYVRVNIATEVDTDFEGEETFTLTASYVAGGTKSVSATSTIIDDGSGTKYDGTLANDGTPNGSTSDLDDDRTITVAASGPVNEASQYAMFTVTANAGQSVLLALGNTATTADRDATISGFTTIQYYNVTSSTWQTYDENNPPTIGVDGKLSVRVNITSERDSDYEGAETFTLTATYASGGTKSASATSTIIDDGTGTKYDGTITSGSPNGSTSTLDDDRTLTVSASGPVNEASQYAMFSVTAEKGLPVNLAISQTGTAPATTTAFTFEYSADGTSWLPYTWNGSSGNRPTLTAGSGTGTIYVRVDITSERDTNYEGAETFELTASYESGNKSANGTSTIIDDGSGTKYDGTIANNGSPNGNTSNLDDDRVLSVTGSTISESSPYAVFEVTANSGDTLTLALSSGTATIGTDTGTTLQYYTGTHWQNYSGSVVVPNSGRLLVRVAIVDDNNLENSETFSLVATRGANSASGTTTIVDNGTSANIFRANNDTATPTLGTADNDSPPAAPQQRPAPPPAAPPARPAPVPALAAAPISATVQNLASTPATPVAATPAVVRAPLAPVVLQVPSFGGLIADRPEFSGNNFKVNVVATETAPGTTFSATMPDGSPLPAGVTIDSSTGQISGLTPQGLADLTVRILATSPEGSRTLEIKIEFPDQRSALEVNQEFATLEDLARVRLDQPFKSGAMVPVGNSFAFLPSNGLPSFSQRLQDLVLNAASSA